MAIKIVAPQFIGVNVQLYFNSRLLHLNFIKYLGHQVLSVGCLLGIAVIAVFLVDKGLELQNKVILSFLLSGILYTLMVAILGYVQPVLFGLQRRDIHSLIQSGIQKFR